MILYEVTVTLSASQIDDFTRLGIIDHPPKLFKVKTISLEDHTKPIVTPVECLTCGHSLEDHMDPERPSFVMRCHHEGCQCEDLRILFNQ